MNKDLAHIKEFIAEADNSLRKSSRKERGWLKRLWIRDSIDELSKAIDYMAEDLYNKEEEEPASSITPLEEFLNNYGLSVSCTYSRHTGKWHASLDNAEVAVNGRKFLKSPVETSNSLDEAVFYLAKRLRGEELKVEGGYIPVPKNLTYQYNE